MKAFSFLVVLISLATVVQAEAPIKGSVVIDGSSTVGPISTRMAEEFNKVQKSVKISVGIQGTGGGFKTFCTGKNDINDASRPITESEKKVCAENKVEYLELPVAIDGLSIVVNKQNDWCKKITTAELKQIWDADSKVKLWSDVNPKWPAKSIKLFGPGTASGTFDYFCEEVLKKKAGSRADYQQSEDDNVLVQGVAGDKYALGYFGYAYYQESQDEVNALAIVTDKAPDGVLPTAKTIGETYPLSRPLFIYINKKSLKTPAVKAFAQFYLATENQNQIVEAGFINLHPQEFTESRARLAAEMNAK